MHSFPELNLVRFIQSVYLNLNTKIGVFIFFQSHDSKRTIWRGSAMALSISLPLIHHILSNTVKVRRKD